MTAASSAPAAPPAPARPGATYRGVTGSPWFWPIFWGIVVLAFVLLAGLRFGLLTAASIVAVSLTKATPLTLGALAGVCSERSGVVNIAIEGLMLIAAFTGFFVGVYTRNLALALLAAVLSGGVMALLHAVLSITFKVDQIISGTVVNILAFGLTGYLNR